MILMISPIKVFFESKLLDNSLLVIALQRQKFNKVSDSGSWEPLVEENMLWTSVWSINFVYSQCYLQANMNVKNLKLISAILVGALYPNVVQVMTPQSKFNPSSTGL